MRGDGCSGSLVPEADLLVIQHPCVRQCFVCSLEQKCFWRQKQHSMWKIWWGTSKYLHSAEPRREVGSETITTAIKMKNDMYSDLVLDGQLGETPVKAKNLLKKCFMGFCEPVYLPKWVACLQCVFLTLLLSWKLQNIGYWWGSLPKSV